jgi:hypothetical protein
MILSQKQSLVLVVEQEKKGLKERITQTQAVTAGFKWHETNSRFLLISGY